MDTQRLDKPFEFDFRESERLRDETDLGSFLPVFLFSLHLVPGCM